MTVILAPTAAAEAACHEEQLEVWSNEFIGCIGMQGYLRELSYDDLIDLNRIVQCEIKRIVGSAFNHPECRTIRRL